MEISKETLSILTRVLKAEFNKGFNGAPTFYQKISGTIPSTGAKNTYTMGDHFAAKISLRKGERKMRDTKAMSYEIENQDYDGTLEIAANIIKDDQTGQLKKSFEAFGRRAATFPDKLIAAFLKNAKKAIAYDKKPFFSTTHTIDGVTYSNMIEGASISPCYLFDSSQPLPAIIRQLREEITTVLLTDPSSPEYFFNKKIIWGADGRGSVGCGYPEAAFMIEDELTTESFSAAYDSMYSIKDSDGEPIGITPTILLVGQRNRSKAFEVVQSDKLAGLIANPNYKAVEVHVTPWLP